MTFESSYIPETKTYRLVRDSGLYANLCFAIYEIVKYTIQGHKITNVELFLYEYENNKDFYTDLFINKGSNFSLDHISQEEKNSFLKDCKPSHFGLGQDFGKINFKITNEVLNSFFRPNETVIKYYEMLKRNNNVDVNNTIFLWARRTDKIFESIIPKTETYLDVIKKNYNPGMTLLLQTDDRFVIEDFKKRKVKFKILKEIPVSQSSKPFHTGLSSVSDEDFKKVFGITKKIHLIQILCLSLLGKDCSCSIIYPGNPTTYIPLTKGSFHEIYLFKPKK
jgi:hypothetical protein